MIGGQGGSVERQQSEVRGRIPGRRARPSAGPGPSWCARCLVGAMVDGY